MMLEMSRYRASTHVKFQKQGPKFLDDLRIIFGKSHVSGAEDISSDEAGDEDVAEVPKPVEKAEKTMNPGKNKRKVLTSTIRDKDENSPFSHSLICSRALVRR